MAGAPNGGEAVVLGVDLGTTAARVVATTRDARVLARAERGYALRAERVGEVVHDPEQVLIAGLSALRDCVRLCADLDRSVVGLAVTGSLHTVVGLDDALRPLTPSLSWADSRAFEQAERLRGGSRGRALHQETGTPVHPMAPRAKLAWYAEREPELAGQVRVWCGLKDLAVLRLTGRLVTDHSTASSTGLLDIRNLSWHPDALDVAGVRTDQLPDLVEPTAVLSLSTPAGRAAGLPPGLPVVVGGGNGPMTNVGVGAVSPGMASLSLGVGGAFRVLCDRPWVGERCEVFCYAVVDGLWVVGGATSNGGVVGDWAAEIFGEEEFADLLDEAALVPGGANGLLALPYLFGERAPWWDPVPRGTVLGLRREHGRAELTRALVEGAAQQLALVRDAVLASGLTVGVVRASGEPFRGRLWVDVVSAALGTALEISEERDPAALGVALVGWRALGEIESLRAVADELRPDRTAEPDPALAGRLAAARPLVRRAYDALRELSVELGRLAVEQQA
ncbi:gluconokinase [Streptoalloteichus hindustanus]|uniref:Gluconate kinase, FGGY family n=1 Tax=Streptoalloteichus hindustanus TaxID=2017 RepID=A0A1M4VQW8_STRHI|nr:gluconokinase [Streptoalloteichus hindustanus]SHE71233.1 gluconate kinase, FGGY family [Streptoalloteichus hindustanus]